MPGPRVTRAGRRGSSGHWGGPWPGFENKVSDDETEDESEEEKGEDVNINSYGTSNRKLAMVDQLNVVVNQVPTLIVVG